MRTDIFRKVALERLSSPEQLDQIMQTTTPRLWLAMLAVFLLLGAAVVWGVQGSVPTKSSGDGLLLRRGGVLNVVTLGTGVVMELSINPGDHIAVHQVVAKIGQPELLERIRDAKVLLADAQTRARVAHVMHDSGSKLKTAALARQRENAQQQIVVLQDRIKLLEEKLPVQQQLVDKGLITKQQLIDTQQKIIEIKGNIEDKRAEISGLDSQIYTAHSEPLETDETAKAQVLQYEGQLNTLQAQLEQAATVFSPYSGEVIEVKSANGSMVSQGSALLSIQPDVRHLEVIAYIGSRDAKSIQKGMEAEISPSTVKREEAGYLRGKVQSVADFPATAEAMMRNFQNEPLVQTIERRGPVTEVRVDLEEDARSPSGFAWSSPKSPKLKLSSGTLCSVEVVTERRAPISLLMPWLKNATGL